MIISNKQYEHLGLVGKNKFVRDVLPLVRKKYPEKTFEVEDIALEAEINKIVESALHYNLSIGQAAYEFVLLSFRMEPGFELEPENKNILKILNHRRMEAEVKMEKVYDAVLFNDYEDD